MDAAEYQRLSQLATSGMAEAQGRRINRKRFGGAGGIHYTNEGDAPPTATSLGLMLIGSIFVSAVYLFAFWQLPTLMDEMARSPHATTDQVETARMLREAGLLVIVLVALMATVASLMVGCFAAAMSGLIHCAVTNQQMAGIGSFMMSGAGMVLIATGLHVLAKHYVPFAGGFWGFASILTLTCGILRVAVGLPLKFTGTLIATTVAIWVVCMLFVVAAAVALAMSMAG